MRLISFFALTLLASACSDDVSQPSVPLTQGPVSPDQVTDFDILLSGDKLPVLQGTSAALDVTVTRRNGFDGAITIAANGLPNGATAAAVTVAPGATSARITVSADAAAPHSLPTAVSVVGKSERGEASKPLTVTVYGTPGALDTSFAGGRVVVPVGGSDDYAFAIATQPDGKILVAGRAAEHLGDFAVVRLERDGTIDPTFGTGGKVLTDIAGGADTAYAIAVQPDGKIVVAGSAVLPGNEQDFAIVRYDTSGALDNGFGVGGKVTTSFSNDPATAYTVLLQKDGKILVAGDANNGASATGLDFAIARYDAGGVLDTGFGQGGKTTTAIAGANGRDSIYALTLQDVAGEACIVAAGGEGDFSLVRYRADGKLDERFGLNGKRTAIFDSVIGAARAVAVDAGGGLVVAGHDTHRFAVTRLDAAGQVDPAFGNGGKVVTEVGPSWNEAESLALESDGRIVVGGWTYEGTSSSGNFALVRYDARGKLDPVFGGTGIVITEVATAGKSDRGHAVLLQADERIPATRVLVAGEASTSDSDFALTRYWR